MDTEKVSIWRVNEPLPSSLEGRRYVIAAGALHSTKGSFVNVLPDGSREAHYVPSSIDGVYNPESHHEIECIGETIMVGLKGILKREIKDRGFPWPITSFSVTDEELKAYLAKVSEAVNELNEQTVREISELEKKLTRRSK